MSAYYVENPAFPVKERVRGAVGVTAGTDTEIYENTNTYPVLVEALALNCAGGTTRLVDIGQTAEDETYADATYDIATAVSVAAGTPVQPAICPFLMEPGDKLDGLAAGAGIRYNIMIGKPEVSNAGWRGRS